MATGVPKEKWLTDTQIISEENYIGNADYNLDYESKLKESDIVNMKNCKEYNLINNVQSDNLLYYADNFDCMLHLLSKGYKGKIKLIYIDPPYGTNSIFLSRNQKSSYKDDLTGSHFIEFLRRRIVLLKELLSDDGAIYLHLDSNMVFEMKIILDEIFGRSNYRGLITRKKCSNKNYTKNTYGNISDYILYYSKSKNHYWDRAYVPWSEEKMLKEYPCIDEVSGRRYKKVPIHAPGVRNGQTGKEWKGMLPPKGKHWQFTPSKLTELDKAGHIYWSANGNPRRKVYFDESKGIPVQDIWMDVQDSLNQNIKITGYPTEKNPNLIERIIKASSDVGDIVLDCFAGSGTTLDVANQLGRKWVGIDNSSEAIYNILKRFYLGLEEMGDFVSKRKKKKSGEDEQMTLFEPSFKYDSNNSKSSDFSFYSDKDHYEIAKRIYDEYEKKGLCLTLDMTE